MTERPPGQRDIRLSEVGRAIHARHIETPLTDAFILNFDDNVTEVRAHLEQQGFDSAPVRHAGSIVGIFDRKAASDAVVVGNAMRSLWPGVLITANTPLPDLLDYLSGQDLLLVIHGQEITGLITPADLSKPAARSHFYLQFAALEIALATFVNHRYSQQEDVLPLLSSAGMENYHTVRNDLEKKNLYIDIVSSLRMVDLIDIAGKDAQFKASAVNLYGGSWRKLRTLGTSRNDVMHPARRLNTTVSDLVEMRRRIRALTEAAESILER